MYKFKLGAGIRGVVCAIGLTMAANVSVSAAPASLTGALTPADQSIDAAVTLIAANDANGRTVNMVGHDAGTFQKRGDKWVEMDTSGNVRFTFDERQRDEWSVYLFDASRNMTVQLDLHRKLVLWGEGDIAPNALYKITTVSQQGGDAPVSMGVPVASPEAQAALKSPGLQCVKARFGVGYVAKVRWYGPLDIEYEPITRAISVVEGKSPTKEENIAVLQESCIQSDQRMFAQVSVVNGQLANKSIKWGASGVIAVAGVAAKTVICVGTVGIGCPAAVAAGTAAVSSGIQLTASLIPDAQTTFYMGSPGKIEVSGTVWNPTFVESREFGGGKSVNESCSADSDCANNTCARESAREGNSSICCASGQEGMFAGHEYCYGLTRGTQCWSDAMCGSGLSCKGNAGGLKRGTCG